MTEMDKAIEEAERYGELMAFGYGSNLDDDGLYDAIERDTGIDLGTDTSATPCKEIRKAYNRGYREANL